MKRGDSYEKTAAFYHSSFLLFVFATPSFAVAGPTYDEDNLALINAAVSNELASADIPAGIEVNVEFGEITGYI